MTYYLELVEHDECCFISSYYDIFDDTTFRYSDRHTECHVIEGLWAFWMTHHSGRVGHTSETSHILCYFILTQHTRLR